LAFLKFGREDGLEADRLGVGYASTTGWDPRGVSGMLGTLARLDSADGSSRGVPNWALTHPPAEDRVVKVQAAVASAPTATGATNPDAFARRLDGLVFGDSRDKGIVRGNEFLHPILRFAVRFPQGWEIVNGDEQVAARENAASTSVMLLQAIQASGPVATIAPAQMAKAGWRAVSGEASRINGLDAYVGTYEGVLNNQRMAMRAAHVRVGDRLFVVAGLAPAAEFGRAASTFASSIDTFRTLTAQEADRIQPNRVDFYVVRPGDTWESIASGVGAGAVRPSTLAIMNGAQATAPPSVGARIRIVVPG
jgi:predicted Zn-dependent protease